MNKKQLSSIIALVTLCLFLPSCRKKSTKQTSQANNSHTQKTKIDKKKTIATKRQNKKSKKKILKKNQPLFIIPPTTISKKPNFKAQRTITINNNIDDKMLSYKHWTGTYKPSKFHIFINDHEITNKAQISTVSNDGKTLVITYEYEFMNGYRKDKREVIFALDDDTDTIDLTFSWHDKWHILCNHAQPIADTQL